MIPRGIIPGQVLFATRPRDAPDDGAARPYRADA